jgi:hypothetical protein
MPILQRSHSGDLVCFATARDRDNRSYPVMAWVDFRGTGSLQVVSGWTIIAHPGPPGYFDESGLSLSDARSTADGWTCLTFGWRLRLGGGWFNDIGILHLDLQGRLLERSATPYLTRTEIDPVSAAYPTFADATSIMYCSPTLLDHQTGRPIDFRILRGVVNSTTRTVIADPRLAQLADIFAFSRPWILHGSHDSRIYFSMRGSHYEIVSIPYTQVSHSSMRGLPIRKELSGLSDARENSSACYPSLFQESDVTLLLYNGERYGATGFGIAIGKTK